MRERRDVRFHAIPVKDVLGLLDDDVVAAVAASEDSKCKRYPGFAQVLRRAAEGGRNNNALHPQFGVVKSPEFFAEVCRRMRMEGLRAPDLERVLAEITAADRRDIP